MRAVSPDGRPLRHVADPLTSSLESTRPRRCLARSLHRLSPATVAVCASSPNPSLAGAAYALQPPQGGVPSPAGSVPRAGRRPDRDSSTHTTTEQEKTKCHFHPPPTQRL